MLSSRTQLQTIFSRFLLWLSAFSLFLASPILSAQEAAPGGRGAPIAAPGINLDEPVNTLLFRDMPLDSVLKQLEQLAGKPILRSQSLPALKINFDSLGPMSRGEAILVVESLLSLNGILITPVGDKLLKAVPSSAGTNAQVPEFLQGSPLELPASQAFYTKFLKFNYLDAANEGQQVVQGLMSQGGQLILFPKNNAILISDMLINLQRMEQVLMDADRPDYSGENVFFFQLNHIKAGDLRQRLEKLTQGNSSLAKYFANNTTFEADERTNQLIAITHASNEKILTNLITELDKDVEPVTSSEVFYIKHAQATEIDSLLEEVISGQQSAREKSESASQGGTTSPETQANVSGGTRDSLAADAAPMPSPTEGISEALGGESKNLQFSDFITVVADERSNAIVAYGTKSDLKQVKQLIEQIDVLLAQVHIQVLIAEVTLDNEHVSGLSELGIQGTDNVATTTLDPASGFRVNARGQAGTKIITDSPFEFVGSLDPNQFSLVIRRAAASSNVRILSVPNVVTTHNQEANVNVSQSRPIITSQVQSIASNPDGVSTNDVQFRDIGIQLKVKPLIGSNGIIQMEIEQIVENVLTTVPINGVEQPIIGKREATSFVSVADGQVIVLAGLQETIFSGSDGKLWLIGHIPLIGDLINPATELNERRELMLFIQPTVYFGPEDSQRHAKEVMQRLDNGRDVETFIETQDMSLVLREAREGALESSKEFQRATGFNKIKANRETSADDVTEAEIKAQELPPSSPDQPQSSVNDSIYSTDSEAKPAGVQSESNSN